MRAARAPHAEHMDSDDRRHCGARRGGGAPRHPRARDTTRNGSAARETAGGARRATATHAREPWVRVAPWRLGLGLDPGAIFLAERGHDPDDPGAASTA